MEWQKLTLEQKNFVYDTHVNTDSCREVCKQFRPIETFPGDLVPHRNTVRNLVKVRESGPFHDKNLQREKHYFNGRESGWN